MAVARVPSGSKITQMIASLLSFDIISCLISTALATSLVLCYLNEDFGTTFFRLILSVIIPYPLRHNAKSKQFFLVLGNWILFLQVIKLGFQGDFSAALQRLPDDRVKSVSSCQPSSSAPSTDDGVGVILSGIPASLMAYPIILSELFMFLH